MATLNRYYIGLLDKDTKVQIIQTDEAIKYISYYLLNHYHDGATIYKAKGIYKHNNWKRIEEPSIVIEMIDDGLIYNDVEYIKKYLNQESIMVTTQEIEQRFI